MERDVEGGCHCGAVRFSAKVDVSSGLECNCSYCSKSAPLLAFTGVDGFRQTAGAEATADYVFYKKVIHHLFCEACGISAFGRGTGSDGKKMVAVNLRCVDGIDLGAVKREPFDGAAQKSNFGQAAIVACGSMLLAMDGRSQTREIDGGYAREASRPDRVSPTRRAQLAPPPGRKRPTGLL